MTKSKQVTEVKRKTSEIPTRDEELHSEDIPFLQGGLQSGVRPRELGTAPLLWLSPRLTSHSPYSTKWTTSCLDSSLLQIVCVEVMDGASIYSPSKVGIWQLFPVASVASR